MMNRNINEDGQIENAEAHQARIEQYLEVLEAEDKEEEQRERAKPIERPGWGRVSVHGLDIGIVRCQSWSKLQTIRPVFKRQDGKDPPSKEEKTGKTDLISHPPGLKILTFKPFLLFYVFWHDPVFVRSSDSPLAK